MSRVAVVGGGAAGLIAAWRAASLGAEVDLFEKTGRLGTKILISGGGKCNITHDGPIENVLKSFRKNEALFLRPSFYRFKPEDILAILTSRGLTVYTRDDGRIFPVDQTAKDVVAILTQVVRESGARIHLNSPVSKLLRNSAGVRALLANDKEWEFDRIVLSVGGSSYPNSGTTGDGWPWAAELGHSIVPIRAALAPVALDPKPASDWAGVALRNVVVKGRQHSKEITRWRGDLLFTHQGLSGPTILGITRDIAERMDAGGVSIEVDFLPDLSFEELGREFLEVAAAHSKKHATSLIDPTIPSRLRPTILELAGIEPETVLSQIPKKARNRLIEIVKGWHLGVVSEVLLEKGEVVAGGISLTEVDPSTMESNKCPGLFLAGEVLDIAGPVGGYNLQAAWSTGFVAGESAAKP
ncbi:MAG: NAD(P)/FAD-dependent oxidoreductase [Armatimonadetes bacterium]|nr:NAD(P)/FAD-dependent oxidoreductase [Armatimonadota bacterium]